MEPAELGTLGVASLLLGGLFTWRVLADRKRPAGQRRFRDATDRAWPLLLAGIFGGLGVVWLLRALLS